ncbi:hypothetical protein TNCV_272071 [Trichonephila clavipes]|nr:hypothetical protein TNCV_272071 [Trichonephila clavipes]
MGLHEDRDLIGGKKWDRQLKRRLFPMSRWLNKEKIWGSAGASGVNAQERKNEVGGRHNDRLVKASVDK